MWTLDTLYTNMPKEWIVAQEFLFIDARTFLNYNNNMRQLMVDKLQSCELAVLNRFPEGDEGSQNAGAQDHPRHQPPVRYCL